MEQLEEVSRNIVIDSLVPTLFFADSRARPSRGLSPFLIEAGFPSVYHRLVGTLQVSCCG